MNIKEGDYVRWTGEHLEDPGSVPGVFIGEMMVPFTDGIPRKVLKVDENPGYEGGVSLKLEGTEDSWIYPFSQIEVVNNNKYITKPIESYPEWLKDIPRGEVVLCNVWDDEEPIHQKYVIDYSGEERECPYMAINN